jgi:hypothetical protein
MSDSNSGISIGNVNFSYSNYTITMTQASATVTFNLLTGVVTGNVAGLTAKVTPAGQDPANQSVSLGPVTISTNNTGTVKVGYGEIAATLTANLTTGQVSSLNITLGNADVVGGSITFKPTFTETGVSLNVTTVAGILNADAADAIAQYTSIQTQTKSNQTIDATTDAKFAALVLPAAWVADVTPNTAALDNIDGSANSTGGTSDTTPTTPSGLPHQKSLTINGLHKGVVSRATASKVVNNQRVT